MGIFNNAIRVADDILDLKAENLIAGTAAVGGGLLGLSVTGDPLSAGVTSAMAGGAALAGMKWRGINSALMSKYGAKSVLSKGNLEDSLKSFRNLSDNGTPTERAAFLGNSVVGLANKGIKNSIVDPGIRTLKNINNKDYTFVKGNELAATGILGLGVMDTMHAASSFVHGEPLGVASAVGSFAAAKTAFMAYEGYEKLKHMNVFNKRELAKHLVNTRGGGIKKDIVDTYRDGVKWIQSGSDGFRDPTDLKAFTKRLYDYTKMSRTSNIIEGVSYRHRS